MYQQETIKPYNEGGKAQQVEQMFDNIAPTYDTLNHRLSWDIDKGWRKKAIRQLKPYQPQTILDIATGTGDFAIMAAQMLKPQRLTGADISEGMMEIGRQKVAAKGLADVISYEAAVPHLQPYGAARLRTTHLKRLLGLQLSDEDYRSLSAGRAHDRDSEEGWLCRRSVPTPHFWHLHDVFCNKIKSTIMDKYGLIGYPLGHSFSISYFNQKFHDEGIDAVYENFEIPDIEALNEVLGSNPNLKGLNVTIPYKEKVMQYLDTISPEARAIGAVNVIRVTHEGSKIKLKGYNSDVIGFTQSIEPMLDKKWHKKALILGTGGASKAVDYGLRNLGLETVFVSRYERPGTIQYDKITPEDIKEYNVIVNCTPVGMYPKTEECPQLPYEAMDSHTILYDLIYNPDETLFMKRGAQYGAQTKNGLEMLLLQAFASWDFWHEK